MKGLNEERWGGEVDSKLETTKLKGKIIYTVKIEPGDAANGINCDLKVAGKSRFGAWNGLRQLCFLAGTWIELKLPFGPSSLWGRNLAVAQLHPWQATAPLKAIDGGESIFGERAPSKRAPRLLRSIRIFTQSISVGQTMTLSRPTFEPYISSLFSFPISIGRRVGNWSGLWMSMTRNGSKATECMGKEGRMIPNYPKFGFLNETSKSPPAARHSLVGESLNNKRKTKPQRQEKLREPVEGALFSFRYAEWNLDDDVMQCTAKKARKKCALVRQTKDPLQEQEEVRK